MTLEYSRRNFLRYVPCALFALTATRSTSAQRPPGQTPTLPPGSGSDASSAPRPGSGGGGAGFPPPGPAQKGGDFEQPTISGKQDARDKSKDPAPHKPRKDLAADQKILRNEVQRLVLDTQELNKAVEQFGPKQALTAEMIGKTKEIEKLAHDIAALAKG